MIKSGYHYIPLGILSWNKRFPLWFEEGCPVKYPHFLVPYDKLRDRSVDPLEWKKTREDGLVFIDSSGFQASTLGMRLNPKDVIQVQCMYGNLGPIADYPPSVAVPGEAMQTRFTPELFKKNLDDTIFNTEVMLKEKSSDFRLYGVLHGVDTKTRAMWYEGLERFKFDAYAIGVKPPSDIYQLISWLGFISDKKIDTIHLFAVSGVVTLMMAIYVARLLGIKMVTVDSSTFFYNSKMMRMTMNPFSNARVYVGTRPEIEGDTTPLKNPEELHKYIQCDCGVCKQDLMYKAMKEGKVDSDPSYVSWLGALHNLWHIIQRVEYAVKTPLADLKEELSEKWGHAKVIRLCDRMKEYGFEKVRTDLENRERETQILESIF